MCHLLTEIWLAIIDLPFPIFSFLYSLIFGFGSCIDKYIALISDMFFCTTYSYPRLGYQLIALFVFVLIMKLKYRQYTHSESESLRGCNTAKHYYTGNLFGFWFALCYVNIGCIKKMVIPLAHLTHL